jgi:hypothetical protein
MLEITLGVTLVALILYDVFSGIVVPRSTSPVLRLAPFLVFGILWPAYLRVVSLRPLRKWRYELLSVFAPLTFAIVMLVWLGMMILGYAFILYGMRMDMRPPIADFPEALYFAGTSVLTLGFGDVVALGPQARVVVLIAAITGLTFMALEVSNLFTLQSLVQQREQVVNSIISRSGAPASGVVILLRYKELNILPALNSSFLQWENWIASILESHRAYNMLLFFRSTNRTESWVSVLGAMLDAATLLNTAIEDVKIGESELFYWLACSTVQALAQSLRLKYDEQEVYLTFEDFKQGLNLLESAGYKIVDDLDHAWKLFSVRRRGYIGCLNAIAARFFLRRNHWVYDLLSMSAEAEEEILASRGSVFKPRV